MQQQGSTPCYFDPRSLFAGTQASAVQTATVPLTEDESAEDEEAVFQTESAADEDTNVTESQ